MLADDILAAAARGFDVKRDGDLRSFASELTGAQHFSFEADTCAAIDRVALGAVAPLVAALRHSRIPFSRTWVEMELGSLSDVRGQDLRASNFPRRVGILFLGLNEDGTHFDCTVAASFGPRSARAVQLDPYGADVDVKRTKVAQNSAVTLTEAPNGSDGWAQMIAPRVSPFMEGWLAAQPLPTRSKPLPGATAMFILRAAMVGLALMNSRNLVTIEARDPAKINKARKLRGKRAMLSFSEVRVNLSRRDQRTADQIGSTSADIRQHIVRGHFKVRKGGVYWWRPFLRGSAEAGQVIRRGYIVDGDPAPGRSALDRKLAGATP